MKKLISFLLLFLPLLATAQTDPHELNTDWRIEYGIGLSHIDVTTGLKAKWDSVRAKLDTSASISASKISSGTLAVGRIPELPQSKITSLVGTLAMKADLVGGKIPLSQLSEVVISDVFTANSQAAMLSLVAERGDIAIRTDLNKTFVLSTDSPTTVADWKEVLSPTAAVSSVAGKTGAVLLAGEDIASGTIPIGRLPVASSGVSSTTLVTRSDDSRLSDARTPTAHAHSGTDITSGTIDIARLPVATSGTSSTTAVVRSDDSRLSNSRTPTSHTHPVTDISATGTPSNTTYLRGDGTWSTPSGGGLADPGANGFPVRTASGVTTPRSFSSATSGLAWVNPDGLAGNPTLIIPSTKRASHGRVIYAANFLGAGNGLLSLITSGSGAGAVFTGGTPIGTYGISTGTTTTGYTFLGTSNSLFALNSTDKYAIEAVIDVPTFSDGTDTYQAIFGFTNNTTNAGNYVAWNIQSSSFRGRSVLSSSTQGTELGSGTQVAGTTYRLRVEWDGNVATFMIKAETGGLWYDVEEWPWALDGSHVVGSYTNGVGGISYPSGPYAAGLFIKKSAGTNPRRINISQFILEKVY